MLFYKTYDSTYDPIYFNFLAKNPILVDYSIGTNRVEGCITNLEKLRVVSYKAKQGK